MHLAAAMALAGLAIGIQAAGGQTIREAGSSRDRVRGWRGTI
jgi:hypothetical protein